MKIKYKRKKVVSKKAKKKYLIGTTAVGLIVATTGRGLVPPL